METNEKTTPNKIIIILIKINKYTREYSNTLDEHLALEPFT